MDANMKYVKCVENATEHEEKSRQVNKYFSVEKGELYWQFEVEKQCNGKGNK